MQRKAKAEDKFMQRKAKVTEGVAILDGAIDELKD
jgi:hypothetical protein